MSTRVSITHSVSQFRLREKEGGKEGITLHSFTLHWIRVNGLGTTTTTTKKQTVDGLATIEVFE